MADVEKAQVNDDDPGTNSNDRILGSSESGAEAKIAVIEQPIEPAPPSYSLMSKVRTARREAGDDWKAFIFQFIVIVFGSAYAVVLLAITVVIPVAMIAIGSIYLHDCPRERYIPIYLIVGGCFGAVSQLLRIIRQVVQREDEEKSAKPNALEGILTCFLFAWFIAGNVWVYRTFNDYSTEDPTAANYCHPTVYLFSFWLITATYILVAVCCGGICLCGICCAVACRAAM